MSAQTLLGDLAALALEAGREIMRIYTGGFDTQTKRDGSPVTIADQRAEAIILKGLSALAPGAPVIAEEEVAAGRTPNIADRFFLVDPIDGTRDFVEHTDEFTVNIALIEAGQPAAGVVFAPAKGALYAGAGDEAWRIECDIQSGDPISPATAIHVAAGEPDALRLITSKRAKSQKLDRFIEKIGIVQHRRMSSSFKFCLLAAGECDLYPRFGEVSEWDIAAGHAVLAAAGGGLIRADGKAFAYGRAAPDFNVNGFVAFGGAEAEFAARTALGA